MRDHDPDAIRIPACEKGDPAAGVSVGPTNVGLNRLLKVIQFVVSSTAQISVLKPIPPAGCGALPPRAIK